MFNIIITFFTFFFFSSATRDAAEYRQLWSNFRETYPKSYLTSEEESNRYQIFISNLDLIDDLNLQKNPRTYFAMNQFTDMTNNEVMSYFNHPDYHHDSTKHSGELFKKRSGPIPAAVDWRTKGAVTAIADQGQCGSSPYWSAVVSMEGAWAIAGHPLTNFSVQQINDCSDSFGNEGCNGGLMTNAFSYVISGGVESAVDYPYTATDNTCNFNAQKITAKFSAFKIIPAGDEQAFTEALSIVPVATAVSAQDTGFLYYSSGIFDSATCNQTQPCHGIGVVGYGSNELGDYYILKNTWGVTWGMQGYMYLARNKWNMCNIASDGSFILV